MSLRDNIRRLSSALTFQPKSPMEEQSGDLVKQSSADSDYRLDLALQNLLTIGAEFAPDDIILLRKRARYGDPRWLYSLYDEMMRLGPASQILKAREAIKSTQTIWHAFPPEADEDENATDAKMKAARLIRDVTEEAWGRFLPDLKNHLSSKYFYGLASAQVMWRPKAIEGRWSRVTDIRPIPARRFRLDPTTLRFKFLTNPYSWEGPFVDDLQKDGKLIFVETGGDTDPLDQRGLLFQCLIPWAIEQFTVRWRAKRLQNFGMPPVMVTYAKNDPRNKAAADLLADILSTGTRASMPEGIKAELLSAPGAGSKGGDPYEAAIEWCDRAYDKIILGHSQVSGVQVGAGSRSSSGDAIGLFKDVTNSRAKEIDEDIRNQCFMPYVLREFGLEWAEEHCPEIESAVIERDDATVLSAVALNLFQAGAAGSIAVEDLVERCGLKVPEDGELTLAGNVKGTHPAPAEIDAQNKAEGNQPGGAPGAPGQPTGDPNQPGGGTPSGDPELDQKAAKALQKIRGLAARGQAKPGQADGADAADQADEKAARATAGFMAMGDFQAPARSGLRGRRFGAARRQRIRLAARNGAVPRAVLVPGLAAPDAIVAGDFDQAKAELRQTLGAARLVGDHDVKIGILGENAEHHAHRLALEIAGVSVEKPSAIERFYSDDQPRDDNGRWTSGDNGAGRSAERADTKEAHHAAAAHHADAAAVHYAKAARATSAEQAIEHTQAAQTHEAAGTWHRQAAEDPSAVNGGIAREASREAHETSREAHKGGTAWGKREAEKRASAMRVIDAKSGRTEGAIERFYSDDQPRDDHGRWEGGGFIAPTILAGGLQKGDRVRSRLTDPKMAGSHGTVQAIAKDGGRVHVQWDDGTNGSVAPQEVTTAGARGGFKEGMGNSREGQAAEKAQSEIDHSDASDYHNQMMQGHDTGGDRAASDAHMAAGRAHDHAIDMAREHGTSSSAYKTAAEAARRASQEAHDVTTRAYGGLPVRREKHSATPRFTDLEEQKFAAPAEGGVPVRASVRIEKARARIAVKIKRMLAAQKGDAEARAEHETKKPEA